MATELKSFFRTVAANEGSKCHYPSRLDTYGCGCGHDCSYCYAKSQLNLRNKWHPSNPAVADIDKIGMQIQKLTPGFLSPLCATFETTL